MAGRFRRNWKDAAQAMMELNATVNSIHAVFGSVVVFHAYTESGKRVRMVADMDSAIVTGEHRNFIGKWETYKQSGRQFVVDESSITDVSDAMVATFLISQSGIGRATVRKLTKRFGTELPSLLDNSEVEAISSVDGIGEVIALQAIQSWNDQGAKKELIDFIAKPFERNPSLIQPLAKAVLKAYKFYRHAALEKLKDNPYLLWAFCTWTETDQLALAIGIAKDDRRRMVCAVEESLYQLYNDGHTASPPLLVDCKLKSVLKGEFRSCLAIYEAAREDGLHTKRFILREDGGWSLPAAFIMENYVQTELLRRTADTDAMQLSLIDDADTSGYLLPGNNPLDKEQEQAVAAILKQGVVAVVGAAGTGKTSVLYAANDFLHRTGRHVLQVALSGKAAQRLIQQTGKDAYTIESLLSKVAATPHILDAYDLPVLFIDEASMVDLPLMYRILKVFDSRPLKIVAIGDRGQLPPIGPGLVFHKMINSSAFQVVELKTNYRALAGSTIPEIAEIIRSGGVFQTSKDVSIVKGEKDIADETIAQYLQHLGCGTVQIISATKRVMAQANRRLQAKLLENAPVVPRAPEFRIGDKVIYKRNDRLVGLVNGSMGVVVQSNDDLVIVDHQTNETVPADIVIEFLNEGRVPLLLSQVKSIHDGEWYLQHSYAITCHQAQGSEFDCVIVVLEKSQLLDRSWLYTATTRAKQMVIFVGELSLIQKAIDSGNSADGRYVGIRFDRGSNGA
jgi:exodeoxyribonuclease V alpha subunit